MFFQPTVPGADRELASRHHSDNQTDVSLLSRPQDLTREAYWSMGCIGTIVGDVVAQLGPMSPAAADIPQLGRLLLSPQLVPCFVLQLTITALVMDIVGADMPDTLAAAAD
jgi:hypothetical protein